VAAIDGQVLIVRREGLCKCDEFPFPHVQLSYGGNVPSKWHRRELVKSGRGAVTRYMDNLMSYGNETLPVRFSMRFIVLLCLVTSVATGQNLVVQKDSGELSVHAAEVTSDESVLAPYRAKAMAKWEKEIKKIQARDKSESDPKEAILFIGSSSIRRWDDIATDMAPFRTIQRGYGGAKYSDVAVFAKRLLSPHQYRALVIFVGNDVQGKPEDHTPDQVEALARYVVSVSKSHQPDAPVFMIEVTPTSKRYLAWPAIRKVNARLREIALSTSNTHFIATAEHYLDPEGRPRDELFVSDLLHLNEAGYDQWAKLIRSRIAETLQFKEEFEAKAASVKSGESEEK
jgi:lysophospholipase L1-like esterase